MELTSHGVFRVLSWSIGKLYRLESWIEKTMDQTYERICDEKGMT